MLVIILALVSALGYGVSDFAAGLATRAASVIQVTLLACLAAAVLVLAVLPFAASHRPSGAALAWGAAAGASGPGHPREYATFQTKYAVYVKQKHVIDTAFFIRHSSGLTADIFKLDRRGYLKPGYFADVLVFDPDHYVPKADYVHPAVLSEGVKELFVNGVAAVDNSQLTGATAGRPLPHIPTAGTCR